MKRQLKKSSCVFIQPIRDEASCVAQVQLPFACELWPLGSRAEGSGCEDSDVDATIILAGGLQVFEASSYTV